MGSATITDQERSQVAFIAGSTTDIHSTTVARLYEGRQGRWDFMAVGIISLVSNRVDKTNYIKMFDLKANYRIIFEQEIYDTFVFSKEKDFFFTFEGDSAVYGLSFADITEAAEFHGQLLNCKQGNLGKTASVNPNTSSSKLNVAASTPTPAKTEKKKEKKGGFMSKFFSSEEKDLEISAPTNFKHESHIGWDPENGFDIKNIPPDWRKLFQSAGIKKSELKNAETAQFIVNIIGEQIATGAAPNVAAQPGRSAPPPPPSATANAGMQPGRSAPPPPPSHKGGAPPPPPPSHKGGAPPPPPPPSTGGAPPPPPPPPPAAGGPPPPPPPAAFGGSSQPSSGGSGGRADLLASIRSGTSLKAVDKSQPLPDIQNLSNEGNRSLVDTLAAAMANRRGNMREDEDDDDDEEDEDWSDY